MNLDAIEIFGLFGKHRHKIEFLNPDRITIIYGDNGIGKTTLLEIIDKITRLDIEFFMDLVFRDIFLHFSIEEGDRQEYMKLLNSIQKDVLEYKTPFPSDSHLQISIRKEKKVLIFNLWDNNDLIIPSRPSSSDDEIILDLARAFLRAVMSRFSCNYIPTQRVRFEREEMKSVINNYYRFIDLSLKPMKAVRPIKRKYPEELVVEDRLEFFNILQNYKAKDEDFNEYYQRTCKTLQSFIPERIRVQSFSFDKLKDDVLIKGIQDASNFLFSKISLEDRKVDFVLYQKIMNQFFQGKHVYCLNKEQFLTAKENIIKQLNFNVYPLNILTNKQKKRITKGKLTGLPGIIILDEDRVNINLSHLSSGEMNLLLMFYQIIFHTQVDTLVLIDEPEISLHILWQVEFLKRLQEIQKVKPLRFLIATHSPQIIHDRRDLCYDVRGEE